MFDYKPVPPEIQTQLVLRMPQNLTDIFYTIKSNSPYVILERLVPKYYAVDQRGIILTDMVDTLEVYNTGDVLWNSEPINPKLLRFKMADLWIGVNGRKYLNEHLHLNEIAPFFTQTDYLAISKLKPMDWRHKDNLFMVPKSYIIGTSITKAISLASSHYPVDGYIDEDVISRYLSRFWTSSLWTRYIATDTESYRYAVRNMVYFAGFTHMQDEDFIDHPSWDEFTMFGGPNSEKMGKILNRIKKVDINGKSCAYNELCALNPLIYKASEKHRHQFLVYIKQALPLTRQDRPSYINPYTNLDLHAQLLWVCKPNKFPDDIQPYIGEDSCVVQDTSRLLLECFVTKSQTFPLDKVVDVSVLVGRKALYGQPIIPGMAESISKYTGTITKAALIKEAFCNYLSVTVSYKHRLNVGDKIATMQGKKATIAEILPNKYFVKHNNLKFPVHIFSNDFLTDSAILEGSYGLIRNVIKLKPGTMLGKELNLENLMDDKVNNFVLDFTKGIELILSDEVSTYGKCVCYPILILRLDHNAEDKLSYSSPSRSLFNKFGQCINGHSHSTRRHVFGERDLLWVEKLQENILFSDKTVAIENFRKTEKLYNKYISICKKIIFDNLGIVETFSEYTDET